LEEKVYALIDRAYTILRHKEDYWGTRCTYLNIPRVRAKRGRCSGKVPYLGLAFSSNRLLQRNKWFRVVEGLVEQKVWGNVGRMLRENRLKLKVQPSIGDMRILNMDSDLTPVFPGRGLTAVG